jgi:anti-sigma B factor antagonist
MQLAANAQAFAATVDAVSVLDFSVSTAGLDDNAFVVAAAGEADMYTAPALEQALDGVIGLGGTSAVLDLAEVSFIDSTVLGVLLRYRERLQALGGDLVIVSADRRVLRTFEITGLDRIFTIQSRLDEGIGTILPGSNGKPPAA